LNRRCCITELTIHRKSQLKSKMSLGMAGFASCEAIFTPEMLVNMPHSSWAMLDNSCPILIQQLLTFQYFRYEGMNVKNWPRYTILRGKKVWDRDNGGILGGMSDGKFLKRGKGKIVVGKTGGEVNGMLAGERDYWV
jgi:hypothetical protein